MSYLRYIAIIILYFLSSQAFARDIGQWENTDPEIKDWYAHLMQPDVPTASCCGEADAYWCDVITVREPKVYCKITDDRDDVPLRRPHINIGTEIEIPPNKYKFDASNPTGHAIVFLSTGGFVFCFVQGTGS